MTEENRVGIEFARVTDFSRGTLLALLRDGYAFEPRYEARWLEQWRAFDAFFFDNPSIADRYGFVTALAGEPIGFVSWDPRHRPDYEEIGHNCVVSRQKGNGYGRAQMREAVARIARDGVARIVVTTDEALLPARRMYEGAGFRLVGRRRNADTGSFTGEYLDYECHLPLKNCR